MVGWGVGSGEGVGLGGEEGVDVNDELKFLGKLTKKNLGGGGGWEEGSGGGVGLVGGQGGCERRIEVFVKIQKKNFFFCGGGGCRGRG